MNFPVGHGLAGYDLDEVCSRVKDIALEAGSMILTAGSKTICIENKKNTTDLVTQVDQAVETFIRQRLLERYPDFEFVGEETHTPGDLLPTIPTFVVDPIDGTSNFIHGFPDVCVSIALIVNRIATVGVVFNPFQNELWYAIQGCGAYRQHQRQAPQSLPMKRLPLNGLEGACIGIEYGSDREGPDFELNLSIITTLLRTRASGGRCVNSVRATGSAAETICRVASGQQDAFWECGCWPWDVAAAWCVLREAGGVIVDVHPGNWNPPLDNRRYLAVRPASTGQEELVKEFWSVVGTSRSTYGP